MALTAEEEMELLELLEQEQYHRERNKLFTYYPDTGPLRRELYKKHLMFFRLGNTHGTRCFMAGNRIGKCITADTLIQHPDGTETKAGDLYAAGIPFKVMAWNGDKAVEALAVDPITKPATECYRVWLSNGKWFDCAGEHRILTKAGWFFFEDLRQFYPCLLATTEEPERKVLHEDCRHLAGMPVCSIVDPFGSGNRVIAYKPIGRHVVYDFTVPEFGNYIASGVVHHNTEGAGGYELTLHLTGRYPEWWEGARFDAPIRAWAAGDTGKTVREIIQEKLLGPWLKIGTGLIPGDDIVRKTIKVGVAEAIDTLWVKHYDLNGVYDGDSCLVFKSYDQGREAFQGTEQDVIWLDEEANDSIRNECVLRLMTTNGLLIETFTPLRGITPVVMQYLPNGEVTADCEVSEDKALIMAGWDDVPHLGESEKRRMLAETPPHLRDARSKGIPSLGAGAIYPVPESEIKVMDFQIPEHWPRLYALDVGWNRTAAVWGAWDKDSDTIYLVAEHYRGQAEPAIHAHAIRSKGEWIPGEIDPASRGRAQKDGEQLLKTYKDLGLILGMANNGVESGIYEVWQRLSTGRLKVFASLSSWFSEYRIYRRDEKGRIVKENDHLMDATRYLAAAKPSRWKTRPVRVEPVSSWQPKDSGMGY